MATDLEKLVVQLSADIRGFDRELAKMNGISNRQFRAVENRARQMNKNLDAIFARSFSGLTAPLTGIGAALSVREVARYADAWTVAGNKLAAAGQVASMQARSLEDLNKIANDTRSGISETADLYAKLMRSTKGVAQSEMEVARATEIVNKAFKAGGAAASEQAAGILQLGQGLGSGMLQGDELRSVRENAPMLAQAIADYFKVSIAGLKDLGAEGKLTSDKVFKAILAAQPQIEAAFNKTNSTISDGLTKVNNAMTQYVGETDKGLGASQRLIAGLNALADNFDTTADIVLKLAAIIAGALVGRSIVSMVRGLGLATSATLSLIAALRTASSLSGLATAFGGIGAAAGPLGMIIGGTVVGALALFSTSSGRAGDGADLFAQRLKRMGEEAETAGNKVEEARRKTNGEDLFLREKEIEASTKAVEDARQAVDNLFEAWIPVQSMSLVTDEQREELKRLKDGLDDGSLSAEDAKSAIFDMARADYNFEEAANQFQPVLDMLANVIAGSQQARAEFAALSGMSAMKEGRSERSALDPYIKARSAGNDYIKDAQRRNTLTKDQLALENEIAAIRKKSVEDGFILTDQQIKAQAQANLAADARRSAEGKKPRKERKTPEQDFSEDLQSIADRTAALIAETEAQRQINPLIDDYGYAIEKARVTQELLNAAQKAGVAITPQLRSEIAATAEQFALATQEAGKLAQAQDDIRSSLEDWRSVGKDATGGVLNDFIAGKSAAEAFADALNKVLDKLLEMSLNGIFGQSGGSNWFSSLFGSIVGRKNGGVVYAATGGLLRGAGGPRSDSIPAMLSNGEYVVNAAATKQFRPILEAINSGRGLRLNDGGMATLKAPTMPILKAAGTKSNDVGSTKIDVGVSVDQNGNLQAYVKNIAQTTTQNGIRSYDKSGAARLRRDSREANRRGLV
ncbi:tape measure domain-containing protein [Pseudochrobactrum saccharolyticum]|uniref:Tape measure domain-containing protein n=1 Tax=Pseudochrobactrum saccharolyticum TaxID=354352 RepID=A0A7W8AM31_9HYPH|nr:tape measure protein [Pseudochrobactrum saccharolyticum]KAB0538467.1 tape measure protein [Pseudochrobactrum saccharolyticum]MBB5091750.1 tape measure domain-containing protein [Pseudochrobactrum saccharolyticum]